MVQTVPAAAREVLHFWFGDILTGGAMTSGHRQLWFGKQPSIDRTIATRFGPLLEAAAGSGLEEWEELPEGRLAKIILLDQFSRNIFRDRPEAFANDPQALALAREGIDLGDDLRLRALQRVFVYLPLEHAEDLACQDESVELFRRLRREASAEDHRTFDAFLDYAIRHRDIIARFGRFPHRNAILGRPSSDAELAFLKQPNSSF